MPASLVINLVSESTIPLKYLRGHHLQRLFLTLVSAVDNRLGQTLQARPAFTLSPLQLSPQSPPSLPAHNLKFLMPHPQVEMSPFTNISIPAGSHCWWRISLLDDALWEHLSPRLAQVAARQPWYLGPSRLHVTNFLPANIPGWTAQASYSQLYQQASDHNLDLQLKLLTPAVFRQGHHDSPLPTRDAIFHGLRKCWNRYSGLVFAPNIVAPVLAKTFSLKTVSLAVGNNETIVGCLGTITFQISSSADPLTIKRLNALVDFSHYCGIGHRTTLGLGLVHPFT
ncbi:MAG: CRISPR system precrRNA processing endoribonuclease RAMP protein Cas6, partial [Cyanobacteria bacterium J06642_11]